MPNRRFSPWLALLLAPVVLLVVGLPALWVFMGVTAQKLHPAPAEIPSVTGFAPLPQWIPAAEQARQIARDSLSAQNLPGLSIAVGIGGDIVWAEGFGHADLASSTPVTPSHRFRIGTASTALTSAAVGLLMEEDKLKLDAPIDRYIPKIPEQWKAVTLGQWMAHTAGMISDGGDEGALFTKHCDHPAEALPHLPQKPPMFAPGTEFRFSNYGWIPVSAAIEAASSRAFLTVMQERVFAPLGMHDTLPDPGPIEPDDDFPVFNLVREKVYDPRTASRKASQSGPDPGRATTYFPRFAADPKYGLHLMRPLDLSCYAGASVFESTPSDLVRFGMGIQSGKLLKPATVETLQTPQRLASGTNSGYGLGWEVDTVSLAGKPTRAVGHSGDVLGGRVATLLTFPDHGITIAVTSNMSYADTFPLAIRIAEAFVRAGR